MPITKIVRRLIASAAIACSPPAFTQEKKMNDYSSPKAVYESMRDASQQQDWGRYLACLTTAAQKIEMFEMLFACAETSTDEGRRILRTFIDGEKVREDYDKKKEAKLRAIAAKGDQQALREAQEDLSSIHNDLYADALFDHIADKVGFYAAASTLLKSRLDPVLGDFEEAAINGDTATGTAKMTTFHIEFVPGQPQKKVADKGNKTFHFRKIDGKWLIDVPR